MTFRQRIKAAIEADPSIIIHQDDVETTVGFEVSHFEALGLTRTDLKKLVRAGLAIRGYLMRSNDMRKPAGYAVRYALVTTIKGEADAVS